ncbi:MAG: hypothetical protein AAGE99_04195, partial [Chlamydiota bacterium]
TTIKIDRVWQKMVDLLQSSDDKSPSANKSSDSKLQPRNRDRSHSLDLGLANLSENKNSLLSVTNKEKNNRGGSLRRSRSFNLNSSASSLKLSKAQANGTARPTLQKKKVQAEQEPSFILN